MSERGGGGKIRNGLKWVELAALQLTLPALFGVHCILDVQPFVA